MLRVNRSVLRRSVAAAHRQLSTQRPDAGKIKAHHPSTPPPKAPAMGGGSPAGKAPVAPPPPPTAATPVPAASPPLPKSSPTGPGFGTLLLLTALSAPAGAAVYLKQNPEWNPEVFRHDDNWVKFRELVLGDTAKKSAFTRNKQVVPVNPVGAQQMKPKPPAKSPEELSAMISKANPAASLPPKQTKQAKPVDDKKPVEKQKVAAKKSKTMDEKPVSQAKPAPKTKEANATPKKKEQATKAEVAKATVTSGAVASVATNGAASAAVVDEKPFVEKIVDDAVAKERKELDRLAGDATPAALGGRIDKQIQSTTNEIVQTLQSESTAAALDVDKTYLSDIHELDANTLAIRVAQLATEMKHRSKWEAVRLLEALRRMEEDTKKKGAEVLDRQQALHKELLERELRLQEEVLMRKTREELNQLKKQYAEDLLRNVQKEKTTILKSLQEKYAADKKAIEDKYALQLKTKTDTFQETLTKERTKRLQELENFRAQLRALNSVLERTSTYEAFSHQVHKASMAALALSDRIEAAGPLRSEIRALQEFARNDPFVKVALKTLPEDVLENGAASVSQLQERFRTVKAVGRRAAMVPEGSGLIGQLLGGALSYLIIPPGGPIDGTDPDAIFSRADYALKAGDIEKAVVELKTLSGLPAEVSRDWIAAAEDRLAVELTAKVVKAHISLLAASCA